MDNWIDLDNLPKRTYGNVERINWINSCGIICNFYFDNIKGNIKIVDFKKPDIVTIEYNGKNFLFTTKSLRNCKIGKIFNIPFQNFKFDIGDIIQYHKNNLKITDRFYKEHFKGKYLTKEKSYKVQCNLCKNEFDYLETQLLNKNVLLLCPYCNKRRIKVGYNDLWTTHPQIAELLYDPENGYIHSYGSGKKVNWKCKLCNSIIYKSFREVTTFGLHCPHCSETMSYPNKFMHSVLRKIGIHFIPEKAFVWSQNRIYDFYIELENLKIIIEMHGIQHYEANTFYSIGGRTLEEEQDNDLLKYNNAINNGIDHYIVIDSRISDFNFIKTNVLKSNLSMFLNFDKIDWCSISKEIEESLTITISDLWNSGMHDVEDIRKKLNISKKKTTSLLNRAKSCNLCNYDPNVSQKIGREKMKKTKYQKYSKPVKCQETNEFFGNYTLCGEVFAKKCRNVKKNNIYDVLSGKTKGYKGYTFCYISKNEFNCQKEINPQNVYGDYFYMEVV